MSDHVLYSTVSDASQWPPEVSKITELFSNVLPSGLLACSPRLSCRTKPLWKDVVQTPCATTGATDLPIPFSDDLTGMVEVILHSVAMLQSLKASGSTTCELRPAMSFLLHAMGSMCLPNLKLSGEHRFALSRYHSLGRSTVGQVFKMMSVMTPIYDSEEGSFLSNPSAPSTSQPSDSSTSSYYADPEFDETLSTASELEPEEVTHPVDVHFLDMWQDRKSWICPFICVADEPYIREAMVSAAFHRFNWGISEPVVGLGLMDDGTSIIMYFAWAEPSPRVDNMPLVRVVSTLGSDAATGAYDLLDPNSTLLFAQFLLSLRSTADAFRETCAASQYRCVEWRADSSTEDQFVAGYSTGTTITRWINEVEPSLPYSVEKTYSSPSLSVDSIVSSDPPSFVMRDDSSGRKTHNTSRGSRSSQHSQSEQPRTLNAPIGPTVSCQSHGKDASAVRNAPSEAAPKSKTSTSNARTDTILTSQHVASCLSSQSDNESQLLISSDRAASRLCAKSEKGVAPQDEVSIGTFLHDRNVIEVACAEHLDPGLIAAIFRRKQFTPSLEASAAVQEINEMVEIYNRLTDYIPHPSAFDASVVSSVSDLYKELIEQVASFKPEQSPDSAAPLPVWDDVDEAIIAGSLSSLLVTVQLARTCQALGGNEAEARHSWDSLIHLSCVAQGEAVSPRLRLERMIPLSQNELLRETETDVSIKATLARHAKLNEDLTTIALTSALGDGDLMRLAASAHLLSLRRSADVEASKSVDEAGLKALAMKHANEESFRAKCGSFIGFPALEDSAKVIKQPLLRLAPTPVKSQPLDPILEGEQSTDALDIPDNLVKMPLPPEIQEVNPHSFNATETRPTSTHPLSAGLLNRLVLPVFAGEYKKESENFKKALRRLKLYLISAVAFLFSLGIGGHPVFGLATNGTVGVVLCAWRSKDTEYTYIMDRNVRSFDLTVPIQMYQFATFMRRLRKWSDETLTKLVQEHIGTPGSDQYKPSFSQKSWTKAAQEKQYFPKEKQPQRRKRRL